MTPPTLADRLSLGWRTELIFARFDGEVADHGSHLCVRTPTNPDFWWGNFLLFAEPPADGDLVHWQRLFDHAIAARQPGSRHCCFGIDAPGPVVLPAEFVAAGFLLREVSVLTLQRGQLVAPTRALAGDIRFDVLNLPHDGAALVDQQVAADAVDGPIPGYRDFVQRQMQRQAAMQRAGLGHAFGLVASSQAPAPLVASCGLFRDAASPAPLGRFQLVTTHPAWRRRGLCTALVYAACRHGFEAMGLETLVMLADPGDVAIGIYESLGFRRVERTWQIERAPR